MVILYLDTETFCETPITAGTHRYAEGAEVLLVQVALDDGPVAVWETEDHPLWAQSLQTLIDQSDKVVIHKSDFERTVLRRHGVVIPTDKIDDTMVVALQHGLPGSLGQLCDILGVPTDKAKDKDGKKLIQLFTKPRPKNMKLRRATRETHPDEWQRFIEYARLDVDAMRSVRARLPRWNDTPRERELWRYDQDVNDHGFAVDAELAVAALRAFDRASGALAATAAGATGGAVTALTQRGRLLAYLKDELGFEATGLAKADVSAMLAGDLPPAVRELIELRKQAAATSPAKYKALTGAMSSDHRLRGTLQFCGAPRTGRDCLAEGAEVLVKHADGSVGAKPIERVTTSDLVWDGVEWVGHAGVVYSGDKEVIEHDNVVATSKHVVYLNDTDSVTLGDAKAKGLKLWRGNGTQFTS